jgi:hypothetical protein
VTWRQYWTAIAEVELLSGNEYGAWRALLLSVWEPRPPGTEELP